MLSYQHAYHAGNLADVHKHGMIAWILGYLTKKPKPLTYFETHAGRGIYDLTDEAARKTKEADAGIRIAQKWFEADDPYAIAIGHLRAQKGTNAYPGSPYVAAALLRDTDSIILAERHPAEVKALAQFMRNTGATVLHEDGFAMALSRTPPTPRRGILLCDPSYETASDYTAMPAFFGKLADRWNVGVLVLWYPILTDQRHRPMLKALQDRIPSAFTHEVGFPPAREGHNMVGSGLFIVNPPYGIDERAKWLSAKFAALFTN